MWAAHARDISVDILNILVAHQRLASKRSCLRRPCDGCISAHQERVAQSVSRYIPVDFVLPGFPGKMIEDLAAPYAIRVAATLRLADLIEAKPRQLDELAAAAR